MGRKARANRLCNLGRKALLSALLATTVIGGSAAILSPVQAQDGQVTEFRIPAGPLGRALSAFGSQSGTQLSYETSIARGLTTAGIHGAATREAALARILHGTGLTFSFTNGGNAIITKPETSAGDTAPDGSIMLGTIVIGGGGSFWDGSAETVYSTPGNVAVISGETLETYQVTNPTDIFRGTTGVMSGDGRNSGSLNVNIHGMQGQGRVPVTVDGAQNAATVYRGYQGNADRSFVDPDFISSVGITKGPSSDRPGIGGSVAITTIGVDDIVLPGRKSGFRLKFSANGNSINPEVGRQSGLAGNWSDGYSLGVTSDRPTLFEPTGGSASLAWARKGEWVDFLVGVSHRESGNYFAGTDGPSAGSVLTSCLDARGPFYCWDGAPDAWKNAGISPYFAGEEVMNTSNRVNSGIANATFHLSEDTKWELGYSRYETTFGEVLPSRITTNTAPVAQRILSKTELDSLTSRFRFNPAGNDLVDLRWNSWITDLTSRSAPTLDFPGLSPASPVSENLIWGMDVSNTMRPAIGRGDLTLVVGASYTVERTQPDSVTRATELYPLRDARRSELGLFTSADWRINDLISLHGGLRYTYSETEDFNTPLYRPDEQPPAKRGENALDPSFGISLTPWDGVQLYANYREATRLPSIVETSISYGVSFRGSPAPEHARNIDVGVNIDKTNVFGKDDRIQLKFGYFQNRIEDYIARKFDIRATGLEFFNIDEARFEGVELAGSYERGGFSAGLSATYYKTVEFCRTLGSCANTSLSGDLAANHIPPKFQIAVDMSQKFLDDKLTLGGRITRVGSRAADAEPVSVGMSTISAPIKWKPYTTVDFYARYQINDATEIAFDIQNLTDTYYVEPLSLGQVPGPGRTARLSLDFRF